MSGRVDTWLNVFWIIFPGFDHPQLRTLESLAMAAVELVWDVMTATFPPW